MLSDEEKQAIEYLKQNDIVEIQYDNYGLESIHRVGIDEKQIILNLIEKQSKKIEEIKKEAYNFGYRNGCNDTSKFNDKTFIRIDKIKAKIEELDEVLRGQLIEKIRLYFEAQKEILQSLLEEE